MLTNRGKELKRLNEQLSVFRFLFQEGSESMPLWVVFQTTGACNLTCPQCQTHGTPEVHRQSNSRATLMPRELLRAAASETLPFAPAFALALNGEPLATPNLSDFIQFVRPFGSKLELTTNAMLFTAERLTYLLPVLSRVDVSIDGATPFTIESIRRGAKYQTLTRNIALIARLGTLLNFGVDLHFTIMASNVRELPQIVKLAAHLGVRNIFCSFIEQHFEHVRNELMGFYKPLYNHYRECAAILSQTLSVGLFVPPPFPGVTADPTPPIYGPGFIIQSFPEDYEPNRLTEPDLAGLEEEARQIVARIEAPRFDGPAAGPERTEAMKKEIAILSIKHGDQLRKWWAEDAKLPFCHYLHRAAYLGPGGDVYPCCVQGRPTLGMVSERSMREIWTGEIMDDFRKRFQSEDPYPVCRDCYFRKTISARDFFERMGIAHIADPDAAGVPMRFEELQTEPGVMVGFVDNVLQSDDELLVEGWSYDSRTNQPAHSIALVANSQVFYARSPNVDRPDLVLATGRETVRRCGFRFQLQLDSDLPFRILGVSKDHLASELPSNDYARLRIERS